MDKTAVDWKVIEKQYRAGTPSIRVIAKSHELSEGAIRKHAKNNGWLRDLTEQVKSAAKAKLVRMEVRTSNAQDAVRTENEIVEMAATMMVQVVRGHREDIATGRSIVQTLMGQLVGVAENRDSFENIIEIETQEDTNGNRRGMMMKAISLPVHAATIRDLSQAMKNLIGLERQAFNLADGVDAAPPELPLVERVDEHFMALKSGFAKILGHADAAG